MNSQTPHLTDQGAFIHFVDVINHVAPTNLHQVLELRGFLTYLAGNACVDNHDTFSQMGHNYLLYECAPGKFTFLPWDMTSAGPGTTNIFPSGWVGPDRISGPAELTPVVLGESAFKQAYLQIVRELLSGPASPLRWQERIDLAKTVLKDHLSEGILRSFDGWTRSLARFAATLDAVKFERPTPRLLLNEVMSSNSKTITDERGRFSDWIEIFNEEDRMVDVSECYLTDDPGKLRKWRVPAGTFIPPGGFLLLWADGQSEVSRFHTNFKLNAQGEALLLSDRDEKANGTIDRMTIPNLPADTSLGRIGFKSDLLVHFDKPTPRAANDQLDLDGDGMPDLWERFYRLDAHTANASSDADGDGLSNYQEYLGGTNPNDPNSPARLQAHIIRPNVFQLMWPASVQSVAHWVERSTNLKTWAISPGTLVTNTDSESADLKRAYFRLRTLR